MKAAAIARGDEAGAAPKRPRPAPACARSAACRRRAATAAARRHCAKGLRSRIAEAGFSKVDYVAVREAETLKVVSRPTERPLRVLAAAWLGSTRLIDNVPG